MKTILVIGPVTRRAGYGEQARFALRSLRAHEDRFNILIQDIPWGKSGQVSEDNEEQRYIRETIAKTQQHLQQKLPVDITLQVTIPNEFKKLAPVNIGYTAGIETTKVSPQWIEQSALMDKIILVSNHSKDVYEKTTYEGTNNQTGENVILKTQVPMEVVNYPVRSLEIDDLGLELRHDFNFLTIAQMGPRKNLANTVKWFLEEFQNDEVGLVVKTNMVNCSTADGQFCLQTLKTITKDFPDRKCSVHLLHGDLSLEQMNSLYTHPKMKSFVTLTHGEGYGLPIFEAAYHGLPVIAPGWSGQNDFLYAPVKSGKQKKAKLRPLFAKVDYTIGKVPQQAVWDGVIQADAGWCYPTEDGAKTAMRDVYDNHSKYIGLSRKLKKHILANFTEEQMTTKFVNAVVGKLNSDSRPVDGISFCVITNGEKKEKTELEIKSIHRTMKNVDVPYEVVVSGIWNDSENIKVISAEEEANTGKTSTMRNKAADASQYSSIVFIDDDIVFPEEWASSFVEFSQNEDWNVLSNRLLLPDGGRCWDRATISPHQLVDYDHPTSDLKLYQTSGFVIIRKDVFAQQKWDDNLGFYQPNEQGMNEDVEYSMRLAKNGFALSFDENNTVWHNDDSYVQMGNLCLKKEIAVERYGNIDNNEASNKFVFDCSGVK